MTCAEARQALTETLTGSTPPALRRTVGAHLEECAACRIEAARLEETAALLRAGPDPSPPEGFWPGFMLRLEERLAQERTTVWTRLRRRLAVPTLGPAAATAIVVLVFVISTLIRPALGPDHDPPNAFAPYVTESMRTLLPSMEETVEIWRSGLAGPDGDALIDLEPGP